MITHNDLLQMSTHLRDAMNKEELHTSQTGRFLNLNPMYVSLALNPKHFDSLSLVAKTRLLDWHISGEKISDFKIPEGEEIWQKVKPVENQSPGTDPKPKKQSKRKPPQRLMKDPAPVKEEETGRIQEVVKDKNIEKDPVPAKVKDAEKDPPPSESTEIKTFKGEILESNPETARLRVALDIEINLVLNGQKIQLR